MKEPWCSNHQNFVWMCWRQRYGFATSNGNCLSCKSVSARLDASRLTTQQVLPNLLSTSRCSFCGQSKTVPPLFEKWDPFLSWKTRS